MGVRPMLAVMAIVALAGCHRRMFEKDPPRGEVMVASTTVITNADVPVTEPEPASPAPAATATPAVPATPPAVVTDPLPTREQLARDAGATATAAPAPSQTEQPAPAPPSVNEPTSEQPRSEEPAPRRHPSAADRIPWAGDSYVGE